MCHHHITAKNNFSTLIFTDLFISLGALGLRGFASKEIKECEVQNVTMTE